MAGGDLHATSPIDGAPLGDVPCATPEEVRAAVERGRRAAEGWGRTPLAERLRRLGSLRTVIMSDLDAVVARITAATGKPDLEARPATC